MSKFLLDTHALIWYLEDSPSLSQDAKEAIDSPENGIFLCSASLLEIAIKTSLNKLRLATTLDEFLDSIAGVDITILQVENSYLEELIRLPLIHKDPFDRLIVSTALVEELTVVTVDENIMKYGVPIIS